MKKYSDEEIKKTIQLRNTYHYSFAELQHITGIPQTTIRNWCKEEINGTRWDILLLSNKRKREQIKLSELDIIDSIKTISEMQARLYASLLYWCEGAKYPATNKVQFVNSDPDLMKIFMILMRKAYKLDESKFRVHLQLHSTHDQKSLKVYWSKLLRIPEEQFIKPTITSPKGRKHRVDYLGTCTVKYIDFRIQLRLIGLYEMLVRKFSEDNIEF